MSKLLDGLSMCIILLQLLPYSDEIFYSSAAAERRAACYNLWKYLTIDTMLTEWCMAPE